MRLYTQEWYRTIQEGARRSARAIVPLVLQLIQPRRVVDVGCGLGTWLSVFQEFGVGDVMGIDGSHVDLGMIEIPLERFRALDLERPFRMEQPFDLVVSLEVAEHLSRASAEAFIESLTCLGPVILFSAAIPFQGGQHHINEQWPDYWAGLFQKRGFVVVDCLRKQIWQNEAVEWWYAQNILIYVRQEHLEGYPVLKREAEKTALPQLSLIHPRKYLSALAPPIVLPASAGPIPTGGGLVISTQEQPGRSHAGAARSEWLNRQAATRWAELRHYLGSEFRSDRICANRSLPAAAVAERPDRGSGEEMDQAYHSDLYSLTAGELCVDREPSHTLLRRLVPAPASVLDYCCGIGTDGLRLLDEGYVVHFAGSPGPGTQYLQWRLAQRHVEATIYDRLGAALPHVDVAICWDVSHQADDPESLLRGLESLADVVIATFVVGECGQKKVAELLAGIRERYPVLGVDRSAGPSGQQVVAVAYLPGIEQAAGDSEPWAVDLSAPSPLGEQTRFTTAEVVWLLEGGARTPAAARWHAAFHRRRPERWAVASGPTWPHSGALNLSVKRSFLLDALQQAGLEDVPVDAATVEAALTLAGARGEPLPAGCVRQACAPESRCPVDLRARRIWLGSGAGQATARSPRRLATAGAVGEPDLAASVLVVGEGDDPRPLLETLAGLAEDWRDDWELVLVSQAGTACEMASLYLEGDFQVIRNPEPVEFDVALHQAALAARGHDLILPTAAQRLTIPREQFLARGGMAGWNAPAAGCRLSPRTEAGTEVRQEPALSRG